MMPYVDVTGKEELAPICPNCAMPSEEYPQGILVGIRSSLRYYGSKASSAYWECPCCYHVFRMPNPLTHD